MIDSDELRNIRYSTNARRQEKMCKESRLLDLLLAYPIRSSLLQHLSAFEAAKLESATGEFLSKRERDEYYHPIRDIFWDFHKVQALIREGLRLILLGKDARILTRRCYQNTQKDSCRSAKQLHIYLIGLFPIMHTCPKVLFDVIKLSVNKEPSWLRVVNDSYELNKLRRKFGINHAYFKKYFILSFGLPIERKFESDQGKWFQVLDPPERTLKLRVYVPGYRDRLYDNIQMPASCIYRISNGVSRKKFISSLIVTAKATIGNLKPRDVIYSSSWGLDIENVPLVGSLLLIFAPFFTTTEICFWLCN